MCFSFRLAAQDEKEEFGMLSSARSKSWANYTIKFNDTLSIDTVGFDPASIVITSIPNAPLQYEALSHSGKIVWKTDSETPLEKLQIHYRVLAFDFTKSYQNKSPNSIDNAIAAPMYSLSGAQFSNLKNFVDFNSLDYQGSYSRSLAVGNSQEVGLNSNFNLQLNGYVLDSVRIEAAITDNSIPFQPDGNTYQVQEFDKLYITFEKNKHKLTAGDFYTTTPNNSYFLQYNKRVQGLMINSEQKIGSNITNKVNFSGSIAKGQYARNIFNAAEGNQGPYKLTGNNGEQAFIVLAATEKVYIDGILMERGEDRDYIINYNTGEVKFMPRQMITKEKRIQIEFEYQDRNYLNSLFQLSDEINIGKKWQVRLNAYSNQDAKNQPYLQTLDANQKSLLASIGDNINEAFYRSMSIDTVGANKILYRMEARTIDNILYDSVFVYSVNPDSTLYSLNFSNVGAGNGNYMISNLNTNGRSYQWIDPINGVPQGEFEPVILLITPKKHQLFSLGTTYQIDSNKRLNIELASSNYDPNLFSPIGNNEHWGYAGKINYIEKRTLNAQRDSGATATILESALNYEYVDHKFKAIAPFRNLEFNRDWNIDSSQAQQKEHLFTLETGVRKERLGAAKYNLTYFKSGSDYQAYRNIVSADLNTKKWRGNATFNVMNSTSSFQKTTFFRPSAFLERRFEKLMNLSLGVRYEMEDNKRLGTNGDSLLMGSNKFEIFSIYLKNEDSKKTRINLKYSKRKDWLPLNGEQTYDNSSDNLEAKVGLYHWDKHQINFVGAYRSLYVTDKSTSTLQTGETILGRIEYNSQLFKGLLVPTLLYEVGTGQEQKREYTYTEVEAGLGMYMWVDYNNDGIQQANEFEIAFYPDQKRFIRTLTLTNEYAKVNYTTLNLSLQIQPEMVIDRAAKGFPKFARKFSNQLALQINKRLLESAGLAAFNIFKSDYASSEIISQYTSIINTLYFNRSNTKFGIDYAISKNLGRNLLTYGLEMNSQERHLARFRIGMTKKVTLQLNGLYQRKGYESGVDDNRTYRIETYGVEPNVIAMFSSKFRFSGGFNYEERNNAASLGGERAIVKGANTDVRWSTTKMGVLQAKLTFADIQYNGQANTSLTYNMLDALSKGQNYIWSCNWEIRLGKAIELSLDYEGRKPGENKVIHTGRMSIRALL